MGGKNKRGRGQSKFSTRHLAPRDEARDKTFYEDDPGNKSDSEGTLTIEVSCTPYGSSLKKPTDFFRSAFAKFVEPYVKGFDLKGVLYVKEDIFVVRTSMKYIDVIQKIAKRNDLTHATKKITIIDFSKTVSPENREDSSRLFQTQSVSVQRSQLEQELKCSEEDCVDNLVEDGTLLVQVLCTPNGSKLKKPIDFFNSAFASIAKPYGTAFDVKSVTNVKDDIFLVGVSMKYIDIIQKIAERSDLEYGGKKLQIIAFLNSASSKSRKDGDKLYPKQSASLMEKELKPATEYMESAISDSKKGRVVEICGDADGLGSLCQMYFERDGGLDHFDIESINISDRPQTITFFSSQGARRFIDKGKIDIGKQVYFKLFEKDAIDQPNEMHHGARKRDGWSNSGTVADARAATRKSVHSEDDKQTFGMTSMRRESNEKKEFLPPGSIAEYGNKVEIYGDVGDVGRDTLEMYLESERRSGGGNIKEADLDGDPPSVVFEDPEAAMRVVERGSHKFNGKEFHFKYPVVMKEKVINEEDNTSCKAFSEDCENIVEIHGDITGLGKESLEVYLETKKRSGGGEIKEMNLDAVPPWVIFHESEAKERVVERGVHSIDGNEFHLKVPVLKKEEKEKDSKSPSMSNSDGENIVEIHGDIAGLGKESLEMYLETKKRSGGGEIKEMNLDAVPPWVIFHESEAKERVIEKGLHTFDGKQFRLKAPVLRNEKKENDSISPNIFNSDCQSIVEIHGNIGGFGKESLEIYLENTKRSGGGNVQEMNLDASPPYVVFCDSEAAKRVVEIGLHVFEGKEFSLKYPLGKKEKTLNDDKDNGPSFVSNIGCENLVEIHGDITGVGKETLQMYLESKKRSGGGDVKEMNLDANPPWVEFLESEAAACVIMRKEHTISGARFQLKRPIAISYRDNVIILRNVKPNTSKELLSMYVDKLCSSPPTSIKYNHDKSAAMATVPCKIDWIQVKKAHSKKPTLDDAEIAIEKMPVFTSAIISNIADTVTNDHLGLLIEKHCGNDSVEDLDYVKGNKFASIRFNSPSGLENLLKQEVVIEGNILDVEEYNPSFVTERISKMMKKEPSEVLIIVDGLIMEHLMKNHKTDLCQRVGSEVYTKRTTSTDDCVQVQACFSHRPNIPNQSEIFQSYYNEFVRKEASIDVKDKSMLDLASSLSVTVHNNPHGTKAVVIGRKPDVEKFLDAADKDSHIQTEIELPPEKIKLLKSTGFLEELGKSLSVKIEMGTEKIRVVGPEPKIARLESKLNLKMQNITNNNLQITDSIWKCLQNQEIFLKISSIMEHHRVIFTVSQVGKTINLHAMSQKDLSNGIEKFKQTVVEEQIPLSESEASFIMGQKGSQIVDKLLSSGKFILAERSQNSFKFTGLANECFVAKEQLTKVLKENAFLTKLLPFSLGKTKAVLTICIDRIDNLLRKNSSHQVSVHKSEDECAIKVTGYGQAVYDVAEQIEVEAKVIRKEDLVFQRPGLSKVIELDSLKHIISSLEKDKNVVIIQKEQDKEGTVPSEEIEREYDIVTDLGLSTLICTYKRGVDVSLSVYKGDITKHKADVIVNPANNRLWLGGGVAGAILSAGGNSIQDECNRYVREYGNLYDGEVTTTAAGKLSCKKIIHAVGPSWPSDTREIGEQELNQNRKLSVEALTEVMMNVLEEAEKEGCHVLAVPAISSGVFGFPKDRCAEILISATRDKLQRSKFHCLREVHFVNNDDPTVKVFVEKFTTYFGKKSGFIYFPRKDSLRKSPVKSVRKRATDLAGKKVGSMQRKSSSGMPNLGREVAKFSSANGITVELVIGDLGKLAELEKLVLELLAKANLSGLKSIAFPGLGTGQLGFPKNIVAKIMVDCAGKFSQNTNLEEVMLVAFDKDAEMITEFRTAVQKAGSASASAIAEQPKLRAAPSFGSSLQNEEELFFKLDDVEMEIKCGDITKESVDAIVVLGNKGINLLGAVGNAIKEAEGEEFKKLLKAKGPQAEGTTKLIKTSKLPSKFLAHIVPASESYDGLKLAAQGMFEKCNSKKLRSVSLPAIGTGVMGKSPEESAKLILHSFVELSMDNKVSSIRKVNIVLFEERLVSAFRKSLKDIAKNPQKSLGERVISWIRNHVGMFMKSLFPRNGDEDAVADSNIHFGNASLDSPLAPVVFTVYFSNEKRVVNEVRERMTKVLDDHITSSDVQKEAFKNLPHYNFEKIRSFARKLDVLVELDKNVGKIKLSGYHRDLASVTEYCHEVAAQKFEYDQRREKEQTVAKYVQWKEKQGDGSLCDYDPVLNYQIETQYKEMSSDPQIDIAEGDAIRTYKLDFSTMKITRKDGKEAKALIREELAASASTGVNNLPKNWDPMPKDSSGLEVKVHCVQLQPNSQEFVDVSAKFTSSSGGQIYNIVKIERIQNLQLYKSYLAKRESMEKTAGQANVRELELYHGTNPNSVVEINENGFNRSFAGVNGTAYGVGVYFAKDASYSVGYATRSGSLPRCMYLAKVLAGKYTGGNPSYKVAPKGYDTVVDNPNSPRIHVVFYDNQCYPEYLLHFT